MVVRHLLQKWLMNGMAKIIITECSNCFCIKYTTHTLHLDYESMLGHLNIPTLQQRRLQLKASMMCQFVHGESYIPEDIHREKMPNTTVVYFTKML